MVELDAFLAHGYARIEQAVPRTVADDARDRLWRQLGASPDGPWTEPVRWAADLTGEGPFGELVTSPALAAALDRICGVGRWRPRGSLGNVPVRFPVPPTAYDRGWHVDANTPGADGSWAVSGRPHTVLLLTLLSDVGPHDAPTRIRAGSHRDVARVLSPDPLDPFVAGPIVDAASEGRPVHRATGDPGDMYLLHPFTVHAADEHRGHTPRFMAQAPIMLTSPVEPGAATPLASVFD